MLQDAAREPLRRPWAIAIAERAAHAQARTPAERAREHNPPGEIPLSSGAALRGRAEVASGLARACGPRTKPGSAREPLRRPWAIAMA